MLSRLGRFLVVSLFFLSFSRLHAQDIDYLRHNKIFYVCSIKRECTDCYSCGKQRFLVKIKNNSDKKVKSISYQFYSEVYNKVLTKEAKVEGKVIDPHSVGQLYVCVPIGLHWIISKIIYSDESSQAFVLHDRMENFIQEPDECDCND
jgi:hypothetical protein